MAISFDFCRKEGSSTDPGWLREDSWAAWAATAPAPVRREGRIERVREELRLELRSALRHAYLGPQ